MTETPVRILITGSRDAQAGDASLIEAVIWDTVYNLGGHTRPVVVVDGACPTGVDDIAHRFVSLLKDRGYQVESERHPAEWFVHGKAAGPIRNKAMVDLGADRCIAFYKRGSGNRGTNNCATAAEAAGIPVLKITLP